ncbi:MAG TPA: PQQ-binding-like beta-propeller repeat protein [Bacteroidales bacterium]|nr:PQQ-binding-like beta-propeller repeat protein [Bacteroidales bacterium]
MNNVKHITKMRNLLMFLVAICIMSNIELKSQISEWPCFHGTDRTNTSKETGLLKSWPEGGPSLLYTISGLGEGFNSTSIAGGMIFTAGKTGDQSWIFAFDMNGKLVWKKPSGEEWKVTVSWASSYNGPRSTPTYDNGVVYHLSESGKLTAYRSKDGSILWTRDLPKDFNSEIPMYGYAESVLIEGDNLYVRPGGQKGYQACLDKKSGKTIWSTTGITGDYGYSSTILSDFGGFHQVLGSSNTCYYSMDAKTGKILWIADFRNKYEINCSDPIVYNDYVLLTSGEGKGCTLFKQKKTGTGITIEKVWETKLMDNYFAGILLHNGYIYGCGNESRGWYCLDFKTGKQMWKTNGEGCLTYADGMLYLYDVRGNVKLIKASPEKFEVTGEFKAPKGGEGPYWSHPVVCNERLYLRHADKLFIYDINRK